MESAFFVFVLGYEMQKKRFFSEIHSIFTKNKHKK